MDKTISQAALEVIAAKFEVMNKRLVIIIVLLVLALIGTNAAWIIYEAQFEETVQTVTQEADNGVNRFIGGDVYGEADSYD